MLLPNVADVDGPLRYNIYANNYNLDSLLQWLTYMSSHSNSRIVHIYEPFCHSTFGTDTQTGRLRALTFYYIDSLQHVNNIPGDWVETPQYFSSALSPQSLSPSHKNDFGTQAFDEGHWNSLKPHPASYTKSPYRQDQSSWDHIFVLCKRCSHTWLPVGCCQILVCKILHRETFNVSLTWKTSNELYSFQFMTLKGGKWNGPGRLLEWRMKRGRKRDKKVLLPVTRSAWTYFQHLLT